MPRNDTWRGRDAHQGLAEGLGPWRVGWSRRSGSAGVAPAVGRGVAADRRGPDRVGSVAGELLQTAAPAFGTYDPPVSFPVAFSGILLDR